MNRQAEEEGGGEREREIWRNTENGADAGVETAPEANVFTPPPELGKLEKVKWLG